MGTYVGCKLHFNFQDYAHIQTHTEKDSSLIQSEPEP